MQLASRPKSGSDDQQRSVSAEETLRRIEPMCKVAGITRVADITGLDRIGIPVFSSIRPGAQEGAISIYNGKGLTEVQARVSAIMEGLERYSAEVRGDKMVRKHFNDVHDPIDPRSLILPAGASVQVGSHPIAWVEGFDLVQEMRVQIPANAVFHPYQPKADLGLFRSNTNGLASGNDMEEAILHGLCEVVERDAWSICEGRRRVNADITLGKGRIGDLARKFTDKGIELHVKDMTSDVGLPVVAVAADDVEMKDPGLLTLGIGAHPDPEVAVIKAMVEVAQSRLTQIHGAREDAVHTDRNRQLGYDRMKRMNQLWFGPAEKKIGLKKLPNLATTDIAQDIFAIKRNLEQVGMTRIIVNDLTRAEIGIPVVRVTVPGMEVFAIDPDRVGRRLMEATRR